MRTIRRLSKAVFAGADLFSSHPPGPRLLIYHQVGSHRGHEMEVTPDQFVEQMRWLAAERLVVDLGEALRRWDEPNSDRMVVLTFDDGYRDLFTTAFPILRDLGMPFVLYVSTGLVSDRANDALGQDSLRWDDVRTMQDSGLLTVGAHTHSHPDLRDLSSVEIEREIEKSDKIILEMLGVEPVHFAYPYGFWSETADRLVRTRYETAVLGGSPRPHRSPDWHLLHRYPVQRSDGFRFFKARMKGGFYLEEALRRRIKGYEGP